MGGNTEPIINIIRHPICPYAFIPSPDLHELPGKYKSTLDQRRCPASTSATTTGTSRSTRRASRSPRPHPPVLPSSVVSTMAAWSSQQIHEQPQVPLWPTRTAKSSTTSPLRSGAQAPVPQQTPSSPPPSSLPTSSFTLSPLAASPELPL